MEQNVKILDYLQLINSENVGPITFYKLLEIYGSAEATLAELPKMKKYRPWDRRRAELELARARQLGIEILCFDDADYPAELAAMEDRPPLLYLKGRREVLANPCRVAIVGARNASINGRKNASRIAYDLTNAGVITVSGMARGIDSAVHKGAMYAQDQKGATIAVLGTGADVPYPKENQDLYEQIAQNGAIISEFPLGSEPQANNFPRRNRLVAGLSLGTLVVEATLHSGSLITARLALEQGKEVFALPGSPSDARSLGPNRLIKDGANLIENAEDILEIIRTVSAREISPLPAVPRPQRKKISKETPCFNEIKTVDKTRIIDYLDHDGVYVDEIIRLSGKDPAEVSLELLELELSGKIERQVGNKVALKG